MTYWPRTTDPYAPPSSVVTSAWPQWVVTTDTGWQRDTPRGRVRVRKCRRLRNWKPQRRWNGQSANLCSYDEVEEFLYTIWKVTR